MRSDFGRKVMLPVFATPDQAEPTFEPVDGYYWLGHTWDGGLNKEHIRPFSVLPGTIVESGVGEPYWIGSAHLHNLICATPAGGAA